MFARILPKNEGYVDYKGCPLDPVGFTTADVKVGKQTLKQARIVIACEGKKSLTDRDLLVKLIFKVAKLNNNSEYIINNTNNINSKTNKTEMSPKLKGIKNKFANIFKRQRKIVGHTIYIDIREGAKVTQQKGRRVPLQLQKAVDEEIRNLLAAGHIERIDKITDEMFIQPVVITVKKDRSVKIALDARSLNNAILKDKYQMPNLASLMENIGEIINVKQEGDVWFTSLDMVYAYG